jgi:hypothetical protein
MHRFEFKYNKHFEVFVSQNRNAQVSGAHLSAKSGKIDAHSPRSSIYHRDGPRFFESHISQYYLFYDSKTKATFCTISDTIELKTIMQRTSNY